MVSQCGFNLNIFITVIGKHLFICLFVTCIFSDDFCFDICSILIHLFGFLMLLLFIFFFLVGIFGHRLISLKESRKHGLCTQISSSIYQMPNLFRQNLYTLTVDRNSLFSN